MGIKTGTWQDREALVEILDVVWEKGVALLDGRDVFEAQFFDQSVLQGLVRSFDPAFGLGSVRT